jgi:hypothetical protein
LRTFGIQERSPIVLHPRYLFYTLIYGQHD